MNDVLVPERAAANPGAGLSRDLKGVNVFHERHVEARRGAAESLRGNGFHV